MYRVKLYTLIFFIITGFKIQAQHPLINEVQYVNHTTLTDSFEKKPDWIEIYNPSETPLNLKGYQLSDESNTISKWIFPDTILNSNEYLLLFASGKNIISNNEIHLPFQLKQVKDSIFLFSPQNELIDIYEAQCVPADKSIGRQPNGSSDKFILTPTPGYSNNNATRIPINYQQDSLWLNHEGGYYTDAIKIEALNLIEENEIRYTLNGDEVDFNKKPYQTPIELIDINGTPNRFANFKESVYQPRSSISKANILRIQVFSEGCPASEEIVETYFINKEPPTGYKHVPVVSLITDKDNLFDKESGIYANGNYINRGKNWERPIHIELYDTAFNRQINQNAGIRIHGNYAKWFDQKSLRLYARNKYGKEVFINPGFSQKEDLKTFKKLLLRNVQAWSGVMFSDEMSQYLVDDLNIDYSAAETVVCYLNGEFWGVYSLREFFDDNYVQANYNINNPELTVLSTLDKIEPLRELIESTPIESNNFYNELDKIIDIQALIDYYIAQFYLANQDYINNSKFWQDKNTDSKWRPYFYDLDFSFPIGRWDQMFSEFLTPISEIKKYPINKTETLSIIFQNQKFRNQFHARFIEVLENEFSSYEVLHLIDHYRNLYAPLVNDHVYRWGIPQDMQSWEKSIEKLKTYALLRPVKLNQTFKDFFRNPFTVSPNPSNGEVTISFLNKASDVQLYIYSTQGLIKQFNLSPSLNSTVELNLLSGIYIVRVLQENIWYSDKILINHDY